MNFKFGPCPLASKQFQSLEWAKKKKPRWVPPGFQPGSIKLVGLVTWATTKVLDTKELMG